MPENLDLASGLDSIEAYEQLIYGLPETYPFILFSTLVLIRLGPETAIVEGEVYFPGDVVLRVMEFIDFRHHLIRKYSYELYRRGAKIRWYDPWPHPDDSSLANTHPHHVHTPPDIKHNRSPAPGISFTHPNLPFLVQEIESLLGLAHANASNTGCGSI